MEYEQRQKAIGDMPGGWNSRPPQTTVVLDPAVSRGGAADPPALGRGGGNGTIGEKVLVPAGRGVYAHTVLAVDSDTNGPIVLEADLAYRIRGTGKMRRLSLGRTSDVEQARERANELTSAARQGRDLTRKGAKLGTRQLRGSQSRS